MIPGMAIVLVCYTIYRLTKANAWNRRTALLLTLALLLTYGLIRIGSKMGQLPVTFQASGGGARSIQS